MPTALTKSVTHVDVDLGDTAITVTETPDGSFVLDAPTDRGQFLILTVAQMRDLVTAFRAVGKTKGWK